MTTQDNLQRFIDAQNCIYEKALAEIKRGKKTSHWMWFIFPQIQGLGNSETTKFYAIVDKGEATQYLKHPVLGKRLIEITDELLNLDTNDAVEVLGEIDSLKLKSSMTLFSQLEFSNPIFQKVIDKFFDGVKDAATIKLIGT